MPENSEENLLEIIDDDMNDRIGEKQDATRVVLKGHPGQEVTNYAEEVGADCIVIGSHKPELKDYFLGVHSFSHRSTCIMCGTCYS